MYVNTTLLVIITLTGLYAVFRKTEHSSLKELLTKLGDLTTVLNIMVSNEDREHGSIHDKLDVMDKKVGKLACSKGNGQDPAQEKSL